MISSSWRASQGKCQRPLVCWRKSCHEKATETAIEGSCKRPVAIHSPGDWSPYGNCVGMVAKDVV